MITWNIYNMCCCREGLTSSLNSLIVYCVHPRLPQDTCIVRMNTVLSVKIGVVRELGCFLVICRRRCDRRRLGIWWRGQGRLMEGSDWTKVTLSSYEAGLREFGEILPPLGAWT